MGRIVDLVKNDIAGSMNIMAIGAAQATVNNKLADSAKIARNASTIIMLVDKTPDEIENDGAECGNKALAKYPGFFDCDYMQMAHHGQQGCTEEFYKAINFRACLWPTPSWVWEPAPENTWLKTRDTRRWMDEKGIKEHHVSCIEKDYVIK